MSNEITMSAVTVNVVGKSNAVRRLSALDSAPVSSAMALAGQGGRVGKAAAYLTARVGMDRITTACSHDNYHPLAAYLAGMLGECVVISNRASFESLPDQMEQRVQNAMLGKNGGYRTDKKTGAEVPGAKLKLAMTLKAECVEIIARQQELREQRIAAKAAEQAAITA